LIYILNLFYVKKYIEIVYTPNIFFKKKKLQPARVRIAIESLLYRDQALKMHKGEPFFMRAHFMLQYKAQPGPRLGERLLTRLRLRFQKI
jgi:hypothetical protein